MNATQTPQTSNPAPRQVAQCSERVSSGGTWGAFNMIRCKRKAKVERDGKAFCTVHDPVARKAKLEAAMEADRVKWEAIRKAEERTKACVNALTGVNNAAAIPQLIEKIRALILTWEHEDDPVPSTTQDSYLREIRHLIAALDSPVPEASQTSVELQEKKD